MITCRSWSHRDQVPRRADRAATTSIPGSPHNGRDPLRSAMQRAALRIVHKLRRNGYAALFAGGWVRDLLLNRKAEDIDIATDAAPGAVLKLFPHSTAVGAAFGAVQVRMYGRAYDVVTFRAEGAYADGRHPSGVRFSDPLQDARRRDFTINGLFYDPVDKRVIDYVGGRPDLERQIIRTIGDPQQRFGEDKLRMLRAIRFACKLSFDIAPDTWEAIKQLAHEIRQVSWERIRDEFLKIIAGKDPSRGLDLLHRSALLSQLIPELLRMRGLPREPGSEVDLFDHARRTLSLLRKPSGVLALATLLCEAAKSLDHESRRDSGAAFAGEICRRLKLSNQDAAKVVELVRDHGRLTRAPQMRQSEFVRFLRKPTFFDQLEIERADSVSAGHGLTGYQYCREQYEQLKQELWQQPLITGDDLVAMGYRPGPVFRQILESIEDMQLEHELHSREQAVAYVKRVFPPPQDEDTAGNASTET
jgi:tRNA nucleotidyltransferase/poly(A) polymerase